jgi:hypothetical protein
MSKALGDTSPETWAALGAVLGTRTESETVNAIIDALRSK